MKLNDIKPKHLVLGQEYDDFSKATDKVDFSKEDLCCQVIELTAVYYWINTESVWGPLGFTWNVYNNYGCFNRSTINFTIIPKIPDSYRHKKIYEIFKNINVPLIFLDSGWNHIVDFTPSNYNSLEWHLNLDDDEKHTIHNYYQVYTFKGCLRTTKALDPLTLILLPENKNVLHLSIGYVNDFGSNNTKIDCSNLEEEDTLDLREYIHPYGLYAGYYYNSTCKPTLINVDKFKNIIFEAATIVRNIFYFAFDISENNYKLEDAKESITYIFRTDLVEAYYNSDGVSIYEPINVYNNNNIYSKNFNYIGLHSPCFKDIDFYYNRGVFEYETPEVTQEMIDFTINSIFANCYFYKPYKYGKIKCTIKNFSSSQPNHLTYDKKSLYYYDFNFSYGYLNWNLHDGFNIYFTDLFDFEYTQEDFDNKNYISIPNHIKNINTYSAYDLKLPYLPIKYTIYNSPSYVTSKGDIEYFDVVVNRLFILDTDYKIIFNNDTILYLGSATTNYNGEIATESKNIDTSRLVFRTTRENITEVNTSFDNAELWHLSYTVGKQIPYIVRNVTNQFEIKDDTEYRHRRYYLPYTSTEVIAYRVDVEFTYSEYNDNSVVQHILDNIVTIGDIKDSNNRTIKLKSSFYNNMKEETKERLIGDGYTIIEVI